MIVTLKAINQKSWTVFNLPLHNIKSYKSLNAKNDMSV